MEAKIHTKRKKGTIGEGENLNPNEYEKKIAVFDLYNDAITSFVVHAENEKVVQVIEIFTKFSGLTGEFGEFCEKLTKNTSLEDLIKEVSDVEWYLTRLESMFGFSKLEVLEKCKPERNTTDMLGLIQFINTWIGKLGEKLKKIVRDKDGDFIARMEGIEEIFCNLEIGLMRLEAKLGRSKEEVLQVNYEKLHSRWERGKLSGSGDNR